MQSIALKLSAVLAVMALSLVACTGVDEPEPIPETTTSIVIPSAPDPVLDFLAEPSDEEVTLSWTIPDDIRLDRVAIRRSETAFPMDLSEGVEVCAVCTSPHLDEGLTNAVRYFYSAFALDDQNRFIDPETVESVPNDGQSPLPVANFLAQTSGDGEITLTWLEPVVGLFEGVEIRRSDQSVPLFATDGDQVCEMCESPYVDTGLVDGVVYFYSAFVYDAVPIYSEPQSDSALFLDILQDGESCGKPKLMVADAQPQSVLPLDSRVQIGEVSCFLGDEAVNWYRYTLQGTESLLTIQSDMAGEVAVLINGEEVLCNADFTTGRTLIADENSEFCIAIPDSSDITSLTLTAGEDPCVGRIDWSDAAVSQPLITTPSSYSPFVVPDSDPNGYVYMAETNWQIDSVRAFEKTTGNWSSQVIAEDWYFQDLVNVDGDLYALRDLATGDIVYRVFDATTGWLNPIEPIGSHTTLREQYRMFFDQYENRIYTAPSESSFGVDNNFLQYVDLDDCTAPPCAMTIEHTWANGVRFIRGFALDSEYIYMHAQSDQIQSPSIYDVFRQEIATGIQEAIPGLTTELSSNNSDFTRFHVQDRNVDGIADFVYYDGYREDGMFTVCGPTLAFSEAIQDTIYNTTSKGSLSGYDPVNDEIWIVDPSTVPGRLLSVFR